MIGIGGLLKIRLMAGEAIGWCAGKAAIHMALIAICCRVRAQQGKARATMIKAAEIAEAGGLPPDYRAAVALFAAHGKTGELVIRIRRGFVILLMANAALQRHIDEFAFARGSVAIITTNVLMPAQQGEARFLMHEINLRDVQPRMHRVTTFASATKRAVVNIGMAGFALLCSTGKFKRDVAFLAIDCSMLAFQSKAGFLVFKFNVDAQRRPAFGCVTIAARDFNIAVRMIRRDELRVRVAKG